MNNKNLLKVFKEENVTSKEEILSFIDEMVEMINAYSKKDKKRSSSYYYSVNKLFNEFKHRIKESKLVENIDDFWCYDIGFDQERIALLLEYYNIQGVEKGKLIKERQECYYLIDVPAKLLTVEEYADLYQVGVGTVRQWIRRGKIRTARKVSKEWRIPELTTKPSRGYTSASYEWFEELMDLPEEYGFINNYKSVYLEQDSDNKNNYNVFFWKYNDDRKKKKSDIYAFILDKKELENLEHFLVSNSQIEYKESMNALWPEVVSNELGCGEN